MTDTDIDTDSLSQSLDGVAARTRDLQTGAGSFARAMTSAFASSVTGAKQFDDVLKSLALRISNLAVRLAFKPLEQGLTSGLESLLSGLINSGVSGAVAGGNVVANARGGVLNAPSYFPMTSGEIGLAGEAGPEAIMPLARGADGRLGVSGNGGGASVTIQIATPDLESFRRSESYLTGQIARAVARGQLGL